MCIEIESACKGSGRECVFRERESIHREGERERESVCGEIERGSVRGERERGRDRVCAE